MLAHGVPVHVGGVGELDAALRYGNHTSISPYENIVSKIADDMQLRPALVFPREAADCIPGLRVSPLGVDPAREPRRSVVAGALRTMSSNSGPLERPFRTCLLYTSDAADE